MAKIADYLAKGKPSEIDEDLNEQTTDPEVPESVSKRFEGKTVADILKSYAHLERHSSKQGEDIGKLRRTVDEFIALQSQERKVQQATNPPKEEAPVNGADLYQKPEEVISKVVDKRVSERLESIETQIAQDARNKALADLSTRYPGWQQEVASPEFLDWVGKSPVRVKLALAADKYDLDAANDLLELWTDRKGNPEKGKEVDQKKAKRDKQLRDAQLETSGPGQVQVQTGTVYKRHELAEVRLAAAKGDRAAQRYLQAHGESIRLAYAEGRVTD